MRWIDANTFIRFLTADDPVKAARCRALFERMQRGEEEGRTSEAIVAEVVYVLVSPRQYGLARPDIHARLLPLLMVRGLRLPQKQACLRALEIWEQHSTLDYEDALSAAHMEAENIAEIYSYDHGFDHVAGIRHLEP